MCRREALRERAANPDNAWANMYFHAAGMHGDIRFDESISGLEQVAEEFQNNRAVASAAHFHLGLDAWSRRDTANAWKYLSRSFQHHENDEQYKLAGCMLFMIQWDHPEVIPESDSSLVTQLRTMRPLWTRERIDAALKYKESREEQNAVSGKPGQWVVSFYQSQVGPAIGNRCSLHPSCSRYFRQASKEHGIKGIALIGDRLVREPGVVGRAEKTVFVDGQEKIADPVSDHIHE